jgi:hypothetical protein
MSKPTDVFTDPQAVARYAEGPPRIVPGFADLQRMTTLLLAERTPQDARVLVVGAGGGLELKLFAESKPDWQFDGVDPSASNPAHHWWSRISASRKARPSAHYGYRATSALLLPRASILIEQRTLAPL